jgi:hypothetical protein
MSNEKFFEEYFKNRLEFLRSTFNFNSISNSNSKSDCKSDLLEYINKSLPKTIAKDLLIDISELVTDFDFRYNALTYYKKMCLLKNNNNY